MAEIKNLADKHILLFICLIKPYSKCFKEKIYSDKTH